MQMDFRNSAQTLEGSKCGREGNKEDRDFPGGLVIKNPPRNARDAGTVPGQGTKILCALQWVSPQTSTTEPSLWSLHAATRMPVSGNYWAWVPASSREPVCVLSHVQLFKTPWTVIRQAPLSIEFPRQEHWSGLTFPSPRDLHDAGVKPASLVSPAVAGRFFTPGTTWEAHVLQPKMPHHTAETSCASTTTWHSQMNECLKRRRQCKGDYGIEVPSIYPPDPVSILSTSACFLRG